MLLCYVGMGEERRIQCLGMPAFITTKSKSLGKTCDSRLPRTCKGGLEVAFNKGEREGKEFSVVLRTE